LIQKKTYAILAAAIFLIGCAPLKFPKNQNPKPPEKIDISPPQIDEIDDSKGESKQVKSKSISHPPSSFKLSGAIAVNHQGKGWNATLNWSQKSANQYNIRLSGPLGGKTLIITRQNSLVTYQEGRKIIKSNNGEDLLRKQTKIRLPVNNLYYWVRGIPAPGSVDLAKKNANNQLTTLKQAGFTITYSRYMTDSNGNILPSKIRLEGRNVTIKMVIKHWG
jgi:outer membrane lipoprotein LolB